MPRFISKYKKAIQVRRKQIIFSKHFPDFDPKLKEILFDNLGYSAVPSFITVLDSIIKSSQPKTILEIGAGLTTALIDKRRQFWSSLICIDESEFYLNKVKSFLTSYEGISFIHSQNNNHTLDFASLKQVVQVRPKLLIIDGPSGIRFSDEAMIFYKSILTNRTICMIDDTDRNKNLVAAQKLAAYSKLSITHYANDPLFTNQQFSILK